MEDGGPIVAYLRRTRSKVEFQCQPLISLQRKYVFFPISKSANSSIKALLFRSELAGTHLQAPQRVHEAVSSPLVLPYQLGEECLAEVLENGGFKKFTVVRNPYDRVLSCYLDRLQKEHTRPYKKIAKVLGTSSISLGDFLEVVAEQRYEEMDIHYRPQSVEVAAGHVRFDVVGKFEHLEHDVKRIVELAYPELAGQKLGFRAPDKTGAASRRREYYGRREADLVRRIYKEDFEMFGYEP